MPNLADNIADSFADNVYWEPDCPPGFGLLTESDEFNGSALNPKWGHWNPGADSVVAVASGQALVTQEAKAASSACGIYQPLPTGLSAFSFAGKFTCANRIAATGGRYGLMLAQNTLESAPTTADWRSANMLWINAASAGVAAGVCAGFSAAFTEDINLSRRDCSIYLRGRVTNLDTVPVIAWDWCDDGNGYQMLDTRNVGFTPGFFGMWLRNQQANNAEAQLRCEWFRVVAGDVGLTSLLPGGKLIPFT